MAQMLEHAGLAEEMGRLEDSLRARPDLPSERAASA